MATIRINALPADLTPVATDVVALDNGSTRKATIQQIVDIGAPVASQSEAEAGANNAKRMTPLTVKQAIEAQGDARFASAAQGATADTAVQPGDLATVATSGDYNDLTNLPTLGTAAATDATAYATAAQGSLADTATQPGDLATVATTGDYDDLTNKPTLGTAAAADTGDFATAAQAVPSGGTTGQVLAKASNTDNDVEWRPATTGSGGANFDTVAALLADNNTVIGYTGSGAATIVAAGEIVQAEGFRYEVAASGASDEHVTTAGGVKLYVLPRDGAFDIQQWDVSSGYADNSAVIQLAMEVAADAGQSLYLGEKGTVWPCTGIVAPDVAGTRLELRGQAKLLFSGSGYLDISGTVTETTYVATAVAKGSRTLVVNSAAGLSVGDVVIIEDDTDWSFSPSQHTGREAYHAGDFARIAGISSNTLTLEEALRDGYPAAITSKVYKVDLVELHTSAFEVEASDTPTAAAIISCVVGGSLDLHVKGGNQYAAFFNKLWKTDGHKGRYIHTAPNTGNNYGLVVGNAQDCDFYDVYAYGTRRGIATGTGGGDAGICMRNVWFHGGSSDNGEDALGSADLHGDADNCGFIGHRATFFDIGGRSNKIIDCMVSPRGSANPVYWTELAGGDHEVRNIRVTRGPSSTFTTIVSGRNQDQLARIAENYSIKVDGGSIDDGTDLIGILGFYHAAADPVRADASVDGFEVLGGTVASNFRALSSTVANPLGHSSVTPPRQLRVGDNCAWPFLTTHFWITFSGSHTGCRVWAPSTTFVTAFSVASAASTSTAQAFSFVGYPFVPQVACHPYGLTSAAGQTFFGIVDEATASTAIANVTTGKSSDTAGADRILQARVEVSMRGAIAA